MKVGDKLWVASRHIYRRALDGKNGYECMVTKIGRKWVYFTTRWDDNNVAIGRIERFHVESGYIDGKGYVSPGRMWPSREAYEQSKILSNQWQDFRILVDKQRALPDADFLHALEARLDVLQIALEIQE